MEAILLTHTTLQNYSKNWIICNWGVCVCVRARACAYILACIHVGVWSLSFLLNILQNLAILCTRTSNNPQNLVKCLWYNNTELEFGNVLW